MPLHQHVDDTVFRTHHTINITGLEEKTRYFYLIEVSDVAGNRASSSMREVITLDMTAPKVVSLTVAVERDKLT